MAPKVCVPADFGRHHIGAPSHGNLTFNLGEGVKIRANSIILSLNSPVIDELTTNLHQTSLEADDFSREAVDCFVECTYTGEIEAVNLGNFRDVNKISRVFQVSWLVAKCEEYFQSYLNKLDGKISTYSEMLFAVEQAVHLMSTMKQRDLLKLVITKMGANTISVTCRNNFVKNYLRDLEKATSVKVDACIALLESDTHIIAEVLTSHLEKRGNKDLDENTKHLLKTVDFKTCCRNNQDVQRRLLAALKNTRCVTYEDLQLQQAVTQQITEYRPGPSARNPKKATNHHKFASVELLRHPIDCSQNDHWEEIKQHISSGRITDLYSCVDYLWCRLYPFHGLNLIFLVCARQSLL